jgi:glutathione S-transferase
VLTLYATPVSANGRKVLAAAHALWSPVRIVNIDVYRGEGRSPEYLKINPTGKIPTLTDGDFTLWESNAILIYLAEAHGGYALWSQAAAERGKIAQWLFWESAHWQPVLSAALSGVVGHVLFPDKLPSPAAPPEWQGAGVQGLLAQLERALHITRFLCTAKPTLADFSVAGMTTYFRVGGFPFERYPAIRRWYDDMNALDAWSATRAAPFG